MNDFWTVYKTHLLAWGNYVVRLCALLFAFWLVGYLLSLYTGVPPDTGRALRSGAFLVFVALAVSFVTARFWPAYFDVDEDRSDESTQPTRRTKK